MGTDEEFQEFEKAKADNRQVEGWEILNPARSGIFDTGKRINLSFRDKHKQETIPA